MQQASNRTRTTRGWWVMSNLLLAGAIAALGAAAGLYLRASDQAAGLVVEEPERVMGGLVSGKTYAVDFPIHNRTEQSKRVFGGTFFT